MRRRRFPHLALVAFFTLLGSPVDLGAGPAPASTAVPTAADVPMLGGNPARTGVQPGPGPAGAPEELWAFQTGADVASAPATFDGTAYLSGDNGVLYAVDTTTGQERWHLRVGRQWDSTPAFVAGTVYVGGDAIHAVEAATGQVRWRVATSDVVEAAPAVADGVVYVAATDGTVQALDTATGARRWRTAIGDDLPSAPAVAAGTVFVAGFGGAVVALDAATGDERWQVQTGDGIDSMPVVDAGVVFVHSHGANKGANLGGVSRTTLRALDAATGNERWRFDAAGGNSNASSPAVANDVVYVGVDRYLFAVDATTGRERWHLATGDEVRGAPAVVDGTVYVGGDALYAVEAATGREVWRAAPAVLPPADPSVELRVDFRYGSPVVAGGIAYVTSSMSSASYSGREPSIFAVLHAVGGSASPAAPGPLHIDPCGPPRVLTAEEVGIAVALPVASPSATDSSAASMLGGNPARTGEQPGPGPRGIPALLWRAATPGMVVAAPAVAEDSLFVSTWDGVFVALDAANGQERWQADFEVAPLSAAAVANGVVYVGGESWGLYVVDATNGDLVTGSLTIGRVVSAPAIADGTVFFGAVSGAPLTGIATGAVFSVDTTTGAERWSVEASGPVLAPPAVAHGLVYARIGAGCGGPGFLAAVDVATGRPRWRTGILVGDWEYAAPVVAGDSVYVVGFDGLVALDAASGSERWRQPAEVRLDNAGLRPVGAPAVAGGTVYVVDLAGTLAALDAATGEERWRTELPGIGGDSRAPGPVTADGIVYVAGGEGLLFALDGTTGQELWRFDVGGFVATSPVVVGGVVYIGGFDPDSGEDFLAAIGEPSQGGTPVPS